MPVLSPRNLTYLHDSCTIVNLNGEPTFVEEEIEDDGGHGYLPAPRRLIPRYDNPTKLYRKLPTTTPPDGNHDDDGNADQDGDSDRCSIHSSQNSTQLDVDEDLQELTLTSISSDNIYYNYYQEENDDDKPLFLNR